MISMRPSMIRSPFSVLRSPFSGRDRGSCTDPWVWRSLIGLSALWERNGSCSFRVARSIKICWIDSRICVPKFLRCRFIKN